MYVRARRDCHADQFGGTVNTIYGGLHGWLISPALFPRAGVCAVFDGGRPRAARNLSRTELVCLVPILVAYLGQRVYTLHPARSGSRREGIGRRAHAGMHHVNVHTNRIHTISGESDTSESAGRLVRAPIRGASEME